jgi:4-amino-4-deoxy-L-arabinose transferase-like glycosyltransferase
MLSPRKNWLIGIFAVISVAQTLAYFAYLRDDPGNYNGAGAQGDQVAYVDLAQQVLHGTWQGAVHYMPGLPAVIALSQVVTGDPRLGIALVQALVYALVVVFAARLAARAFGEESSVWAAAGVGLNPALGYYAAQALTEFLTGAVLLGLVGVIFTWARKPRLGMVALAGLLIAAAGYLRAEYLGLAVLFALIVVWLRRQRLSGAFGHAGLLVAVTALAMAPWVVRYALATGTPALYNESPFSNLFLMGTWFRVFDEQTFSQLQQIETAPGPREDAIARAATVGPRPELSQRYMEQSRGPYERPLPETLGLAAGNVQLNARQYLVNHVVLAPILIWAGHTPVRQSDATRLPASARYAIWGSEFLLLVLALWQAVLALRARPLAPLAPGRVSNQVPQGVSSAGADGRRTTRESEGIDWPTAERLASVALGLSFLAVVLFLTAVHIVIAVDERFTTPALPLVGLFAGARIAQLVRARQRVAVGYAG